MRLPHWQALQTDFQLFCRRPLIAFRLQMHHMRKNAVFRNQVMRCALLAHGTVAIRPAKTRRTSAHPACNAASLACRFAKISPCIRAVLPPAGWQNDASVATLSNNRQWRSAHRQSCGKDPYCESVPKIREEHTSHHIYL